MEVSGESEIRVKIWDLRVEGQGINKIKRGKKRKRRWLMAKLKMKLGHTIRLHITKWVKEFS